MKLVAPFVALFASATTAADNGIKVACNDDNTIDVSISYDRKADIIDFSYGTCDKNSITATQDANHDWKINLDVHRCGMDNKLRTIAYNQTVTARVGRGDLAFADFQADSWCEYTAEYTVKFNYGTLSTEAHAFSATGGLIDLDFSIASYESTFENKTSSPTQGGDTIHLGLSVNNKNFDHADKLYAATHGKNFVPRSCAVNDTKNNLQYTLFDTADACNNKDVDLVVGHTGNMWTFSHTLFLLGNYRTSSFELSCDILVCDAARGSQCDVVVNKCFGVDGKWNMWSRWTTCDENCGTGSRNRSRQCDNPAPAYGGAKCSGDATEVERCTIKPCPIDGKWSNYTAWTTCDKDCGTGSQSKSRKCNNPATQFGGANCTGEAVATQQCTIKHCPIDGKWSSYTAWTTCDKDCGTGSQSKSRTCNNPATQFGGANCTGEAVAIQHCNVEPCVVDVCAEHKVKEYYDRMFTLSKGASCKDAYDASVVYANTNFASGVADWKANGPKNFRDFCNLLMMTFENTSTHPAYDYSFTNPSKNFKEACATRCGNQNDFIDRYPMAADCVLFGG